METTVCDLEDKNEVTILISILKKVHKKFTALFGPTGRMMYRLLLQCPCNVIQNGCCDLSNEIQVTILISILEQPKNTFTVSFEVNWQNSVPDDLHIS